MSDEDRPSPSDVRFVALVAGVVAAVVVVLAYVGVAASASADCAASSGALVFLLVNLFVPPVAAGAAVAARRGRGVAITALAALVLQGPMLILVGLAIPTGLLGTVKLRCLDLPISGVVAIALGSAGVAALARRFVLSRDAARD